jgi:hypothetical protein
MAKNRLIKSSRGNGYGILDEETNLVTQISLDEAKLIESKKGNGFGVQIGEQVFPVDISGLGNEDVNILKKKGGTALSGQTDSWGSIINPLSEKKFSLDAPSEMGRSAQSFAELDKEQGASAKDMMKRAIGSPSSIGTLSGFGGFGNVELPSLEPSAPKKLSDEEKERRKAYDFLVQKSYLEDNAFMKAQSEFLLNIPSTPESLKDVPVISELLSIPSTLGKALYSGEKIIQSGLTSVAANIAEGLERYSKGNMAPTYPGMGALMTGIQKEDIAKIKQTENVTPIKSSESWGASLYESAQKASRITDSSLRLAKRDVGIDEKNIDGTFIGLMAQGEIGDAFKTLGVSSIQQVPQMALLASTGGSTAGVFAGGTLLGYGNELTQAYGEDKDISATDAVKGLAKGMIEGISETIFQTDLKQMRGLFKLQPNDAVDALAGAIESEGKRKVRQEVIRNLTDVSKTMLKSGNEEGLEEVFAAAGGFIVDRVDDYRKGRIYKDGEIGKLLSGLVAESADAYALGFASGGGISGIAAKASMKPLDKLQKKNLEKYQEIANDENQPKEVRDIALKQIDDIVKYNSDKQYKNYTAIAMLPVEQRVEALKIKNSIDDLEAARSSAKSPEFDAIVERQKKEGQAQLNEMFNERYKTLETERAEARKTFGEKTLDEAVNFMQTNNTENSINEALGSVSSRFENKQPIEVDEIEEAADRLYNIADEIESNEELSDSAKNLILDEVYNKIDKLEKYEFATKTQTTTVAQESTTKGTKRIGSVERKNARQTAITADRFNGEQITFTTPEGQKVNGIASVDNKGRITIKPRSVFSVTEREEAAQEVPFDSNFLEFKESKLDDNGNVSSVVLSDTRNNNTFEVTNPELALDLAIKAKQEQLGAIEDAIFEPIFERVQLESKQTTTTEFVNKPTPQVESATEVAPTEEGAPVEEVAPQNDSTAFVVTPNILQRRQAIPKREKGSKEKRKTVLLDTITDGVKGILKKLNDTLKSIDPNADIIIYASEADMVNGLMASGLNRQQALAQTRTSNGLFTRETNGKIKIHALSAIFDSELVPTEEGITTIPHEIGHVALVKLAQNNKAEFNVMKERLKKALPKEISDKLDAFEKEGYDVNAEEWLAQLGALLTTRQAKFEKTTMRAIARGISLAIKDFIQKIATKLNNESLYNFADSLFREQREIQDVVDFFSKFAESVRNGRTVDISYVERKAQGQGAAQTGTIVKPQFNANKAEFNVTQSNTKEWEKQSSTTQRANTKGSYEKVASKILSDNPEAKTLDFGAGLGIGSDAMSAVLGKNVDSYEPFADNWQGLTPPTFSNVEQINDKYDNIVSLNVLNVVKKSVRDSIVYDIYNLLKEGGSAYISARKYNGDIVTAKNKETSRVGAEEKSRIFTRNINGNEVDIYQKGFDGNELVDYVSGLLGDKATVTKDNSFGASGVVVTKPVFDESEKAIQDMMKGLVKGTEEYARASRMIPTMRLKTPFKTDFNLVDQSRILSEGETEVKAQKSTIREGVYKPSTEKGATEEQKGFAKYIRLVKGMTENDVWLAKAIHSEVLRNNPIFELGTKEAVENEFVNLIDKFMEDGFNTNGKYIFKEYTPEYIIRNIERFTNNYNSAFLYYWDSIQKNDEIRKSVYKEIKERQNNAHETNFVYFGTNQNYNPAFKYLMLRDSIYFRPRVINTETAELKDGKLKDSEFKDSDSVPITYNPDVVKNVYENEEFTIGETWELYTREAMKLPKEDKVKGMEPYFLKESSTKEGKWYKFPQNGGQQVIDDLARLAKTSWNYPAKWCTAGEGYAKTHNGEGDFYIFVDNKTGDARIAVRYVGEEINEVSGLAAGQNTYPEDASILDEVVNTFKGGDKYALTAKANRLMGEFMLKLPASKRAQYALRPVDEYNAVEDGAIEALADFSINEIADIYQAELSRYQSNPLQANLQRIISANAEAISQRLGLNKNAFSVNKTINSKEDAEGVEIILNKVTINAEGIVLPSIKSIKEIVLGAESSVEFPELNTVENVMITSNGTIKAGKLKAVKDINIYGQLGFNPINIDMPSVEYIGTMKGYINKGSNINFNSLKTLTIGGSLVINDNNLLLPKLNEIKTDNFFNGILELNNSSIVAPALTNVNQLRIDLMNSDFSVPELGGTINQLTLSKDSSFNGGEIIVIDNLSFDEVNSNIPFTAKKIGSIGNLMLLNSDISINSLNYNSLKAITNINSVSSTINISAENVAYSDISIYLSALTLPTPNFAIAPEITAKTSSIKVDNSKVKSKAFYASSVELVDSSFDVSEFKESGLAVIGELSLSGMSSKIIGETSEAGKLLTKASKFNANSFKTGLIVAENNSELNINELSQKGGNNISLTSDYSSSVRIDKIISGYIDTITSDNSSSIIINSIEGVNGNPTRVFEVSSRNRSSVSINNVPKVEFVSIDRAELNINGKELNIGELFVYGNSGLKSNNIDTINTASFDGVISYANSTARKVDVKQINFIEKLFVRDESNLELNSIVKADSVTVEGESKLSIKNNLMLGETLVLNDSALTIGGTEVKSQKKTFDLVYSSNEAIEEQDKVTWPKISDWFASKFYERSQKIKTSLEDAEMEFALYTLFLKAGSTPYATREFDEKYAKIFKGLNKADKRALDSVVLARRVVAIDTNFDTRGVTRPLHQPFDDPNNKKVKIKANKESAEKLLGQLESIIGVEKARDINDRATQYFEAFSDILDMKLAAGMIDLTSYNMFKNYEYSPRQFLEYFMPQDVSYSSYLEKGTLIKSKEFKNIRNGSEGFMITDTARLLKSAMIAAHKQIMTNRALSFMYDEGIGQNLTWIKEPRFRTYKDGTIKLNEDGSLATYEAENGFEKMMFKRNGKKVEFQLKQGLANEFYDRGLLDNSSIGIKAAGILSGAWLTQINAVGINPAFGLFINPSMDLSSQVFNTTIWEPKGNVIKQSFSALKGFLEISGRLIKKDINRGNNNDIKKLILEYGRAGGFMTTITDDSNILGKVGSFMGYAGNVTEIASKLSAYKNTKDELINEYIIKNNINPTGEELNKIEIKASYIARSSMDFHRGGTYSKIANKIIPFFNVGVQVKKITIQNMRNNPVSFLKKIGQGIQYMIGLTLYNMYVGADDYEKDKNLQRDKLSKVIFMYPIKFGDAPRGYMALPVGTNVKAFLNIGQVIGESLYYKLSGKPEPKKDNAALRYMQDSIKMFGRDVLAMTPVVGVPSLKSAISYYANFDFYNFKPLSYDKLANVTESAEGASNEDILSSIKLLTKNFDRWSDPEGFGKGAGLQVSPERLQKSLEMLYTSPSYTPHILAAYSLLDNFVGAIAKGSMEEQNVKESVYIKDGFGNIIPNMLGKGTGRMFKTTKPENYDKPDYDKLADIKEEMDVENKRKNTIRREISSDISELMVNAFEKKMKDSQIQQEVANYTSKIKDKADKKYANNIADLNYKRSTLIFPSNIPYYEAIKYGSNDHALRAKYIYKAFGDISDNPELMQDLGQIGFNAKDAAAYAKLLKEKEND